MKKLTAIITIAMIAGTYLSCKKESPVQELPGNTLAKPQKQVNACTAAPQFLAIRTIGSMWNDYGNDIIFHSSGMVGLVGEFAGIVDFDPGPGEQNLTSYKGGDYFSWWFDKNGKFVKAEQKVSPPSNIFKDEQGNTFDVIREDGISTENSWLNCSRVSQNYLLVKKSPSGNILWKRMLKENEENYCNIQFEHTVQIDNEDNLIVHYTGGWKKFTPSGQPLPLNVPHNYYGTFKLDKQDNIYFKHRHGSPPNRTVSKYSKTGKWLGSLNTTFTSMDFDAQGNVYFIGQFSYTLDFDPGPEVFLLTADVQNTMFVQKLGPDGRFIWARTIGPGVSGAIKLDPTGKYIFVAGRFNHTATYPVVTGNVTITSKGDYDAFIIALKQCQ